MFAISVELNPAFRNTESESNVKLSVKATAGALATNADKKMAAMLARGCNLQERTSFSTNPEFPFIISNRYCCWIRVVTETFAGEIAFTSAREASVSSCDKGTIARSIVLDGELSGSAPPINLT
jgi:hypothetical protein